MNGPTAAAPHAWFGSASPARLGVGFLAAAAAIVAIARIVDVSGLLQGVAAVAARPGLAIGLLVAYTAAFGARARAWRALLPGIGERIGTPVLFGILQLANLANHALPLKAGEVVRPVLAMRRGAPPGHAVSSTAVARWLDVLVLLVLASALLPAAAGSRAGIWTLPAPAAGAAAALGGLLLSLRLSRSAGPAWLPTPFARAAASIGTALRALTPRRLAVAALWTLASWLLEGGVVFGAAAALDTGLSPQAAVAVTAFTILFQAFHFTPGGLGVYEASMTAALVACGVPASQGLAVAVLAHGLKFAYAFAVGGAYAVREGWPAAALRALIAPPAARGEAGACPRAGRRARPWAEARPRAEGEGVPVRPASRFEMVAARLWNVVNEGKPFTPVFVLGVLLLLSLPRALDPGYGLLAGAALLALLPLFLIFYRFDFPLKLRAFLWVYLAAFALLFRFVDWLAVGVVLALYFGFTVGLWGTVYYHLRMGAPWTNFLRFWRLVLENPDPTSGNFLEQAPKTLLLVLLFRYLVEGLTWPAVAAVEVFIGLVGVSAVLVHQWFFTWAPPTPLTPTRLRHTAKRISKRVIVIVIDGCRADRLREARTPCLDRLRREGTEFTDVRTVYPARSVVCFSSMLTGAPPKVHGIRSNFVPRLGVRCDSIFTALRRAGLRGVLVGIAHLVDAFGEEDVRTVTSVRHNDEIDLTLTARARQVLLEERPDLLVLQLLSVDQTGHARGSYFHEYREKIEATDRVIEQFLDWCDRHGLLEDATVLVNADHGQGIGIGGHGHLSAGELQVPCILWGKGVPAGRRVDEPRSILDVAPTISYFLGIAPPEQSVGQVLLPPERARRREGPAGPIAVVVPACNEAANLPDVLERMPRDLMPDLRVIVVNDGSTDGTGEVARRHGADRVVRHERNRGLGAALRTGLAAARELDARAVVYLDGDGEYDPREIPAVLGPVLSGRADYVLGSRYLGSRDGQPPGRLAANLVFTALLCLLAGRRITDGQTGFRAFSRRALEVAEIIHDYNYAQVLTLDLLRKGMRLAQVPITYRYRGHGRSFIRPEYLWRVPWAMVRELLSD